MSKSILWVNKKDLSEKAIEGLKEILGEVKLFQLKDFEGDSLKLAERFISVDVIAFQKGSLPPELQEECLERKHIIYITDGGFNFARWEIPQ